MFKSILVPVDVMQPASWQHALPQAIELATASNGTISVVTVVPELKLKFESVETSFQLERVLAATQQRLNVIVAGAGDCAGTIHQEVRSGSIAHEIIEAARVRRADLIVMASRRPEMQDYPLGPNAAQVVRHAPCSVMVLRSGPLK